MHNKGAMRHDFDKRVIILALGLLGVSWSIGAKTKECFSNHIRESIQINQNMKRKYALLSDGQTDRVYRELILSEKATLLVAKKFDRLAIPYQEKGMNLFCDEFVSMETGLGKERETPLYTFSTFQWLSHHKRLKRALEMKRINDVRFAALTALKELKDQPAYHCFTRHMFESIYRLAYFLPLREEEALNKKLPSPSGLFYKIMGLHNLSLSFTSHLDHLSSPFQEKGIPILCRELPDLLKDLPLTELNSLKGI
jgi:hypothetical protein